MLVNPRSWIADDYMMSDQSGGKKGDWVCCKTPPNAVCLSPVSVFSANSPNFSSCGGGELIEAVLTTQSEERLLLREV
jgi:hypothetical protein